MDLLTAGDRQIQSPCALPPHISPFPPTGSLPATLPPQKLRPIRGMASRLRPPEEEGHAADVELNDDPIWFDDDLCLSTSNDDEKEAEELEEEDISVTIKEPTIAKSKRKRKTRRKLKDVLESMVLEMIEKQEQMHKQLLDMIERREKERIMREEAWKQQELERVKRDEEFRAQETWRNLALISFIQNVLGDHIEVEVAQPVTVVVPPVENNEATIPSHNDSHCNPK